MVETGVQSAFFERHLRRTSVMVILRGVEPVRGVELARKAWSAGVSLVEVPLQTDRDGACLRAILADSDRHGYPVGAGTITTSELAEAAAWAGGSIHGGARVGS